MNKNSLMCNVTPHKVLQKKNSQHSESKKINKITCA